MSSPDAHAAMVAALTPDTQAVSEALVGFMAQPEINKRLALSVALAFANQIAAIAATKGLSREALNAIVQTIKEVVDDPDSQINAIEAAKATRIVGIGRMVEALVETSIKAGAEPADVADALSGAAVNIFKNINFGGPQAMAWCDQLKGSLAVQTGMSHQGTGTKQ